MEQLLSKILEKIKKDAYLFRTWEDLLYMCKEWLDGFMNLNGVINGTDYFHSNKIPTNGNTSFVFTATNVYNNRVNVSLRFVTMFDENGNVLSSKGLQNAGSNNLISKYGATVISIPDNVSYIVISLYKATLYRDAMLSFDVSKTDYEEYG